MEGLLFRRRHEGPGYYDRAMRLLPARLVGTDDPVNQVDAVTATASGYQDEGFIVVSGRNPVTITWNFASQVTGKGNLVFDHGG